MSHFCNPMDCSSSGSSLHGISQTRILEWVAISFSRDLPNLGIASGLMHCRQILYWLIKWPLYPPFPLKWTYPLVVKSPEPEMDLKLEYSPDATDTVAPLSPTMISLLNVWDVPAGVASRAAPLMVTLGSQRVGHNWATKLNWIIRIVSIANI